MSIKDFAEDRYVKTFDADEEIRLGSFSLDTGNSGPLGVIRVNMYIDDFTALGGSESMVMKIYPTISYESPLITSDTILLSNIDFDASDPLKENYLGYVKFDFNKEYINAFDTYYPTITIANYTPVVNTFYIGLCYDYPDPIYDNGGLYFYNQSIAMQIYTYQQRSL